MTTQPRAVAVAAWVVAAIFALAFAEYVVCSWHWPLMHDMQVMHYVSFLIDKGWAPYREIGDMNLPGAYLFEGWALHLFGPSNVGWRLWDFSLALLLAGSMIVIARPYHWLAGFAAAMAFTLAHAAEGPRNAGQRDQVIVVLLVVAYAFLFQAVRRRRAWLLFFFALSIALAASVKPFMAPLGPFLLLVAWGAARGRIGWRAYLGWSCAGFAAALMIVFGFLALHGSTHAFFHMMATVLPNYATLAKPSTRYLLQHAAERYVLIVVALAVAAGLLARRLTQNWEQLCLLLGIAFGALNYFAQGKGFLPHRYTLTAFLLLWACVQLSVAARGPWLAQALVGLAIFVFLYHLPRQLRETRAAPSHDDYSEYLAKDLRLLGTDSLQRQVQCLDIVSGCLAALFHLQIEQSNGATGDLLLFQPGHAAAIEQARAKFWSDVSAHPPAVFVLSNWPFAQGQPTFRKLDQWPLFEEYLRREYVATEQREFCPNAAPTSHPGTDPACAAYRLYVRRDSPLLPRAQSAFAAAIE